MHTDERWATRLRKRLTGMRFPSRAFNNALLFLSSFAPLFLALAFRFTTPWLRGTCLALALIGAVWLWASLVRAATEEDLTACNHLCEHVHGHHRGGELRDAIGRGHATVVERGERITAYTAAIAFFGHAVAETNDDLRALIAAARSFEGPRFLVPSRNGELMRWCFANGLRMTQPLTLMTLGLYNEPAGSYLSSILY